MEFVESYLDKSKIKSLVCDNKCDESVESIVEEFLFIESNRKLAERLVEGITSAELCWSYEYSRQVESVVESLQAYQALLLQITVLLQGTPESASVQ